MALTTLTTITPLTPLFKVSRETKILKTILNKALTRHD